MKFHQLKSRFLLSLAFGLVVVVGLFAYGDFNDVLGQLGEFKWQLLPWILGLTLLNYGIRFVKWQYYLRLTGIHGVPGFQSFLIFFSGLAMAITPAKLGEWIKSYFLYKNHAVAPARSAPILLAERFTDGYAMVLLSTAGLLLFQKGWIFVLLISISGLFVARYFRSQRAARWSISIAEKLPILKRQRSFLEGFYNSAFDLFAPKALLLAIALGLVSWLGEGVAFYLVLRGLGAENGWELAVQGVFILSIVTLAGGVLLVPGGLVVAEGGITGLTQTLVSLSRETSAAAALLIRLCTLWFGVLLGVIALLFLIDRITFNQPKKVE